MERTRPSSKSAVRCGFALWLLGSSSVYATALNPVHQEQVLRDYFFVLLASLLCGASASFLGVGLIIARRNLLGAAMIGMGFIVITSGFGMWLITSGFVDGWGWP